MANSKRKLKDTDCKNWLDRKQSNKKERQSGFFKTVEELIAWQNERDGTNKRQA